MFIFCLAMLSAALPAAAADAPPRFFALDESAAINMVRGVTRAQFGPMLHETEESAFSNEPIEPIKILVSITKPEKGCENSSEARCKTVTAYADTSNFFKSEFGVRLKPAFNWTIESVEEYPKGELPHCVLVRLREEVRDGGRDASGKWPTRRSEVCILDLGQRHEAEFFADVATLTDAERAIAIQAPVKPKPVPGTPWETAFITGDPQNKSCANTSLMGPCAAFIVGMVSDGNGKSFVFQTPRGFATKLAEIKPVAGEGGVPKCLAITFEEQVRSEELLRKSGEKVVWPTRKISTCVAPTGFVRGPGN